MLSATIFFLLVGISTNTLAAENCTYSLKPETVKLQWTGYKFTSKTGVSGSFDIIDYNEPKGSKSLDELFTNIKFRVDTASINSDNPIRDKKLALYVFGSIRNPGQITGSVESFALKEAKATASLTINGVTKKVPFKIENKGNNYTFTGSIDFWDFAMARSHKAVSEACKALHTGEDGKAKTWSEVGLSIAAGILKTCSS